MGIKITELGIYEKCVCQHARHAMNSVMHVYHYRLPHADVKADPGDLSADMVSERSPASCVRVPDQYYTILTHYMTVEQLQGCW